MAGNVANPVKRAMLMAGSSYSPFLMGALSYRRVTLRLNLLHTIAGRTEAAQCRTAHMQKVMPQEISLHCNCIIAMACSVLTNVSTCNGGVSVLRATSELLLTSAILSPDSGPSSSVFCCDAKWQLAICH
jgi:hypothetical protein